jgi:hypothetical protein
MTDTETIYAEFTPVTEQDAPTFTEPDDTQLPVLATPQFTEVDWLPDDDIDPESTELERHINTSISNSYDVDGALATYDASAVNVKTGTQPQLQAKTTTQAEPLTALWAWADTPTKTKTKTKRRKQQPSTSVCWSDYDGSHDHNPPYLALYERNPDESDEIHYLRLAFMGHHVTDGDCHVTDDNFWEWESSLSGDERATAIELGRMIDQGEFSQTMNDESRERWDTLGDTIRGIGSRIFRLF